jgi:hypothetical protein
MIAASLGGCAACAAYNRLRRDLTVNVVERLLALVDAAAAWGRDYENPLATSDQRRQSRKALLGLLHA